MTQSEAPFELPEELRLQGGQVWTGTRARVYWLLRLTAERRHRHPMVTATPTSGPVDWVPIHTLRQPWAGGAQGDRRLRDLREHGVAYEHRRWSELGGPPDSTATLYRLTQDPLRLLNVSPGDDVGQRRHPAPQQAIPLRTDLCRLRFFTLEGAHPLGAGATLLVDPGAGPLAPPVAIAAAVAAGDIDPEQADRRYREFLLASYHEGLFAVVSGLVHLVVWTSTAGGKWGPLPALTRAFCALGATHAGTWRAAS